ncbi:unnamed protein product [Arctogadus glacialis]
MSWRCLVWWTYREACPSKEEQEREPACVDVSAGLKNVAVTSPYTTPGEEEPDSSGSQPLARGLPPAIGQGLPPAIGQGLPPAIGQGLPPAIGQGPPPAIGQGRRD